MANKHATLEELFTDIATSIRNGSGSEEKIIADNFPELIDNMGSNIIIDGKPYKSKSLNLVTECSNLYEQISTMPYTLFHGSAVVKDGEIHILGSHGVGNKTKHYKWDSSAWTSVSTLPIDFMYGDVVVKDGEIHIFTGTTGNAAHYKWDGTAWTRVSTLPCAINLGYALIVNNEIHIISTKDHYKWDGTTWIKVSTLPYGFDDGGGGVVINGEIHLFTGVGDYSIHYKWDGTSWTKVSNLPYNADGGDSVVIDDVIYVLSGSLDESYTKYYKWDGTAWTEVGVLPLSERGIYRGRVVVVDGEIHLLCRDHYLVSKIVYRKVE